MRGIGCLAGQWEGCELEIRIGRTRRRILSGGLRALCAVATLLLARTTAGFAWGEKDLLGDWESKSGLEVLRFEADHQFEMRDGIHFENVRGRFAQVDDGIRVTVGGKEVVFRVIRLTGRELALRRANDTADQVFTRLAVDVIKSADALRSLEGFRLGMSATEAFVIVKNKNLRLIDTPIPVGGNRPENQVPGSNYATYRAADDAQIIVAKRLLFRLDGKTSIAIDFYASPSPTMNASTVNLNLAYRVQRFHNDFGTILPIADAAREFLDTYGRPWSQTNDSMTWYFSSDGGTPGFFRRMFSQNCPDIETYVKVADIGADLGGNPSQAPHCGVGIAVRTALTKAFASRDGQFKVIDSQDVITAKFDYDLYWRLAVEGARVAQSEKK